MGFIFRTLKKLLASNIKENKKESVQRAWDEPDIPPLQGDYAKTIFLWIQSKAASPVRPTNKYAKYVLYDCGIRDTVSYHKNLIQEGYFEPASVEDMLGNLKVTELKQVLSELGQTVSGKKEELVRRVASAADKETIEKFCSGEYYVLSEEGWAFLDAHYDYVRLHKHKGWGIEWREYDAHHYPGRSFHDTVWQIFNERLIRDDKLYGRLEYLYMYELLKEEGNRKRALELLLKVIYVDFSGACGMQDYRMYYEGILTKKHLQEYFSAIIMWAPGLIDAVKEYKDVYEDAVIDVVYERILPVQICDKKMFTSFVHSMLDGTYDREKIEGKLKREYNKMIKNL